MALVNAAVSARDGAVTFFHLRDASEAERAQLPDWYDGVGSLSRDVVLSHAAQIPDVAERLVEREVRSGDGSRRCASATGWSTST